MKHSFELYPPTSGPLVSSDGVYAYRYRIDWALVCERCNRSIIVPYDPIDSENISKFVVEQNRKNDCQSERR